jgi:hypothetical protein
MTPELRARIEKMEKLPRRRLDEILPQWLIECKGKQCRLCVKGFERRLAGDRCIVPPDVETEILPAQEKLFGVDALIATATTLLKEVREHGVTEEL